MTSPHCHTGLVSELVVAPMLARALVLVQALVLVLVLTQVAEHLMLGAMKRLPLPCRRR